MNVGALPNPATGAIDFRAQPPAVATTPAVPTDLPTSQALNAAANIPAVRNDQRKPDKSSVKNFQAVDLESETVAWK